MFNTEVGVIEHINGVECLRTTQGGRGHAVYGDYQYRPSGKYVVAFEVKMLASWPCDPSDRRVALDVVGDYGARFFAHCNFNLGDSGSGRIRLELPFELHEATKVEARLFTDGRVPLLIIGNPVIQRLQYGESSTAETRIKPWSTARIAREVAELVAYRGDHENDLYRAFIGTDAPLSSSPATIPFSSTLCQQHHFALDQYRFWCRQLKEAPRFHRKQWEFVFIAQALYERGLLAGGKKGLGFGCGQEPLPALFASFGVQTLATDQSADSASATGWAKTGQHTYDLSALNLRGICTDKMFKELVSFQNVDMNDIPGQLNGEFDFCWSSCSLEHLGSLENGLRFIVNSLDTLRPGGIAVHTTEFNISSNDDTIETGDVCLYRRQDIESFICRIDPERYDVLPIDWSLGTGFAELVVDLPPYGRSEPHIRLNFADFDVTSIGLIIVKKSRQS